MSPSIFSSNTFSRRTNTLHPPSQPHVSHTFIPESSRLAPPSVNGHTGTSGFKHSLRKIPSSFFNLGEAKQMERKAAKGKAENAQVPTDPLAARNTSAQPTLAPIQESKSNSNTQTKTRRALADILGWGQSGSSNGPQARHIPAPTPKASLTAQTQPTPVIFAPPLPVKEPAMLRKRPSRPMSTKSTQSGYSSLAPTLIAASRASIGDDPFQRRGEGAAVVEHVMRHAGVKPASITSSRRSATDKRMSVASGKAMSSNTIEEEVENNVTICEPR
jgi:hypothetical protein